MERSGVSRGLPTGSNLLTSCICLLSTNDADKEEKENFNEKLQNTLNNMPKRDIDIVMGDLNANIGENIENREKIMGKTLEKGMKMV